MVECLSEEQRRYINLEEGLGRVRGNVSLYCRLLKLFARGGEFDDFENAIRDGDYAKACDVIHGIKGLAGNLSLTLLFECSTRLNNQLKLGEPSHDELEIYRNTLTETKAVVNDFLAKAGF